MLLPERGKVAIKGFKIYDDYECLKCLSKNKLYLTINN
jgi:hypothetical protein